MNTSVKLAQDETEINTTDIFTLCVARSQGIKQIQETLVKNLAHRGF